MTQPLHPPAHPIPTVPVAAQRFPASSVQEQLWRLAQLHPGRPLGNYPLVLSVEGQLDAALLAGALNDVVARHDIFRTSFDTTAGQTTQAVHAALTVPVPVIDLRLLPEG